MVVVFLLSLLLLPLCVKLLIRLTLVSSQFNLKTCTIVMILPTGSLREFYDQKYLDINFFFTELSNMLTKMPRRLVSHMPMLVSLLTLVTY
jgi:hypothetical protein